MHDNGMSLEEMVDGLEKARRDANQPEQFEEGIVLDLELNASIYFRTKQVEEKTENHWRWIRDASCRIGSFICRCDYNEKDKKDKMARIWYAIALEAGIKAWEQSQDGSDLEWIRNVQTMFSRINCHDIRAFLEWKERAEDIIKEVIRGREVEILTDQFEGAASISERVNQPLRMRRGMLETTSVRGAG